MGENINILKGEFTRKPEELPPNKLKTAQSLSTKLTAMRKFLYFFFSIASAITFFIVASMYVSEVIQIIILILSVIYGLFKLRDYIRGTI